MARLAEDRKKKKKEELQREKWKEELGLSQAFSLSDLEGQNTKLISTLTKLEKMAVDYRNTETDFKGIVRENKDIRQRTDKLRKLIDQKKELLTWTALVALRQENDFLFTTIRDYQKNSGFVTSPPTLSPACLLLASKFSLPPKTKSDLIQAGSGQVPPPRLPTNR